MEHSFHKGITSYLAKTNKASPLLRKRSKHMHLKHSFVFFTEEELKQGNVK